MSHFIEINRFRLLAAAITICATGFLALPAPAQASPMFPLAPACAEWEFPAGSFWAFKQDNGTEVHIDVAGNHVTGKAFHQDPGGDRVFGATRGPGNGPAIEGNTINFAVDWFPGNFNPTFTTIYWGKVNDAGSASGTASDPGTGYETGWSSGMAFKCAKSSPTPPDSTQSPPAASQQPNCAPACVLAPNPAAPAATRARVDGDVDVYDEKNEPDGAGQVIGVLKEGNQVELVESCTPKSWCQVKGPNVPGGQGWVWGHLELP